MFAVHSSIWFVAANLRQFCESDSPILLQIREFSRKLLAFNDRFKVNKYEIIRIKEDYLCCFTIINWSGTVASFSTDVSSPSAGSPVIFRGAHEPRLDIDKFERDS